MSEQPRWLSRQSNYCLPNSQGEQGRVWPHRWQGSWNWNHCRWSRSTVWLVDHSGTENSTLSFFKDKPSLVALSSLIDLRLPACNLSTSLNNFQLRGCIVSTDVCCLIRHYEHMGSKILPFIRNFGFTDALWCMNLIDISIHLSAFFLLRY